MNDKCSNDEWRGAHWPEAALGHSSFGIDSSFVIPSFVIIRASFAEHAQ
jgi:hypothetical protein